MTEETIHLPAVLEVLGKLKLITADEIEALQTVEMATSSLRLWSDANQIGATCALAHAKPDVLAICARNGLTGLVYAKIDQNLKDVLPVSFAFHVTQQMLDQYKQETPAATAVTAADFGKNVPPGIAMVLATLVKNQEVQAQRFDALAAAVHRGTNEKNDVAHKLLAVMTESTVQQFENWTQQTKPVNPAEALTAAGKQLVETVGAVAQIQNQIQAAAPAAPEVAESDVATARALVREIVGPGGENVYKVLHALKHGIPLTTAPGAGAKATAEQMAAAGVETDQANDQGGDSTEDIFRSQVKVRSVPAGETA